MFTIGEDTGLCQVLTPLMAAMEHADGELVTYVRAANVQYSPCVDAVSLLSVCARTQFVRQGVELNIKYDGWTALGRCKAKGELTRCLLASYSSATLCACFALVIVQRI